MYVDRSRLYIALDPAEAQRIVALTGVAVAGNHNPTTWRLRVSPADAARSTAVSHLREAISLSLTRSRDRRAADRSEDRFGTLAPPGQPALRAEWNCLVVASATTTGASADPSRMRLFESGLGRPLWSTLTTLRHRAGAPRRPDLQRDIFKINNVVRGSNEVAGIGLRATLRYRWHVKSSDESPDDAIYAPLLAWQRWGTSAVGLAAGAAGATAVFRSNNSAGTAALLLLGALFLLVGVVGVVPVRLKFGDNEVTLERTAENLRNAGLHRTDSPTDSLRELAVTYEASRRALPPGGQRTVVLEGVLLQARSLAMDLSDAELQRRLSSFNSDSEGPRVITLALMEARRPASPEAESVLVNCVKRPKSNFEQFHGLRAAVESYSGFGDPSRLALRQTAQEYLNDPRSDQHGDRGGLARQLVSMS